MKIILRDTFHQPEVLGGGTLYPVLLAQALSRAGARVGVASPVPELFPTCEVYTTKGIVSSSRWIRAARWGWATFPFRRHHTDADVVIFVNQLEPLVPTGPARRISVVYDLIPLLFPEDYPVLCRYYRHYFGHVLTRVDYIVAISQNTKKDIQNFYHIPDGKIEVIYCGFNPAVCGEVSEPRDALFQSRYGDYILYVGSHFPHKNLPRLIRAFAILRKRFSLNLVLVGKTDSRFTPAYMDLAETLGVKTFVHFLGMLPQHELRAVVREARVLVCPSLYEGFGMTPLEGMAAGTPVAVSRTSSFPEVCGDAAVYFDPLNVGEIAEALRNLLENSRLREQCILAGLERSKKFSWDNTAQQYLKMFARLE